MNNSPLSHRQVADLAAEQIAIVEWNDVHEELVKRWDRHATYYQIMHNRTSQLYYSRYRWLGGFVILLSSMTATTQFANLDKADETLALLTSIASMVVTGFVGLFNFLHYEEAAVEHKHKANKYVTLSQDLQEMMSYERRDREPVRSFLLRMKKQLNALLSDSLVIPTKIVNEYVNDVEKTLAKDALLIQKSPDGGNEQHSVPMLIAKQANPIEAMDRYIQQCLDYNMDRLNEDDKPK